MVENDGTALLTGVTAIVTPLTPGVTMVDGLASYADIAAGAQTGIATFAALAPMVVLVGFVVALIVHKQWMHPEREEATEPA